MQNEKDRIRELNTMHWNFFKKYESQDLGLDATWESIVHEIDAIVPTIEIEHREYAKQLLLADADLLNEIRRRRKAK